MTSHFSYHAPAPFVPLPARIVVLLSGRGSNFEALADACETGEIPGEIVAVISDRTGAPGLQKAAARSIPQFVVAPELDSSEFTKSAREERILEILDQAKADLICLAGFMRLLSRSFVERFSLRILNIHPSLLPSFPGLEAHAQALEAGVRVTGATVHFVDAGTDTGPILAQECVPIRDGDDPSTLAKRLLSVEHGLYVKTVRQVLLGGWILQGKRVRFPGTIPLSRDCSGR